MAITTQLVGQLGGSKVEKIDINYTEPSGASSGDVSTVSVIPAPPSGKNWRVVLVSLSALATTSGASTSPEIVVGNQRGKYNALMNVGITALVSSRTEVKAQRNTGGPAGSTSFTGVIYYWAEQSAS